MASFMNEKLTQRDVHNDYIIYVYIFKSIVCMYSTSFTMFALARDRSRGRWDASSVVTYRVNSRKMLRSLHEIVWSPIDTPTHTMSYPDDDDAYML